MKKKQIIEIAYFPKNEKDDLNVIKKVNKYTNKQINKIIMKSQK